MIEIVAVALATGLVLITAVTISLLIRHIRFQAEQNQTLIAALMATKSSPYAPGAAVIAQTMPGDVAEQHLGEVQVDEDPLIPEGMFLLGTEPVDLELAYEADG